MARATNIHSNKSNISNVSGMQSNIMYTLLPSVNSSSDLLKQFQSTISFKYSSKIPINTSGALLSIKNILSGATTSRLTSIKQ